MTADEWTAVSALIENAWPGEFTDVQRGAYRTFLDGYEPEAVLAALKLLVERGERFRPAAAEIVAAVNADPGKPTWPEAYQVIRRVLFYRPDERAVEKAAEAHPYVAAFMLAVGVEQLRMTPLDDDQYGRLEQDRLRQQWDAFVERSDERIAAGRALEGPRRQGALRRFDPLEALRNVAPAEIAERSS